MPKRIRSQRRGRGTLPWRSPSHRFKGAVRYPKNIGEGTIQRFVHDPGRSAPLAMIKNEEEIYQIVAAEGMKVGDKIGVYKSEDLNVGQIMELKDVPEGIPIYNIERSPGDGGKLIRTSGGRAEIVLKEKNTVKVSLRSKKFINLSPTCRATIGIVGGGGRKDKPFKKAGTLHIVMKKRGKRHPIPSASSMNPVNHPFGGSGKPGKPKTSKRNAPPGQKVGNIAAKRTGKRKK